MRPVALTCGEPAGIGPEIAVLAAQALQGAVPFFWIGDPRHLPDGSAFQVIGAADGVADVPVGVLAVLPHAFAAEAVPGQPVACFLRFPGSPFLNSIAETDPKLMWSLSFATCATCAMRS